MEPFTHAFTSLAISQTVRTRLPRFGVLMLAVAGVAPDIDDASYFFGPGAFFHLHRALFHSALGGAILAGALAYLFVEIDRRVPFTHPHKKRPAPLTFRTALLFCAMGIVAHIVLDLFSGVGVQLLWPFWTHWYGTDLMVNLDPWMLAILVIGLMLPMLIRLVNEEVGAKKKKEGISIAAIVTFVLMAGYIGARANLRSQAVEMLVDREYHGRGPDSAQAFPTLVSPFTWRGIVNTDDTFEEIDVPVLKKEAFAADRSRTFYKPENSQEMKIAQATANAQHFSLYARAPYATMEMHEADFRFEMRDLRFASDDTSPENLVLRVRIDGADHIRDELFHYSTTYVP